MPLQSAVRMTSSRKSIVSKILEFKIHIFTMPIGNRTAEAEYQSAVIHRLQTRSQRCKMRMQITQDVYDAVDRLEIT